MAESLRICRCCLSEGCYKDIANEYYFSGQKEVYADLLLSTFNVTISPKEGTGLNSQSRLICDSCIQRLREATAFKQQVLDAEKNIDLLLGQLVRNESAIKEVIKSETNESSEEIFIENSSYDGDFTENFTNGEQHDGSKNDLDLDLKDEMDDDAMDGFHDNKGDFIVIKLLKKEPEFETKNIESNKINKKPKRTKQYIKDDVIKDTKPKSRRTNMTSDRDTNMRSNTLKLVINSNICLFRSLKIMFRCFFCSEKFIYIKDLRKHYVELHDDKQIQNVLKRTKRYQNAEISNLSCKVCSTDCKDIDDLQSHLIDKHDVSFEPEGHLLVPYRIEKDHKCVLCDMEFNSYLRLHIHMNSHYTNNMCEACGACFINKEGLRLHVQFMHRQKRCAKCDLTFTTQRDMMKHIDKVHGRAYQRMAKCLLCEKTFKYFYQLYQHKVEAHGSARRAAHCADCNKSFISHANLRIHIRSVHLRERNYRCETCGAAFFTKTDQRRHERTHTTPPALPCNHCSTQFKSKDSWRRHMYRQHPNVLIKR